MNLPAVVRYKEQYFVCFAMNYYGKAKLISVNGSIYTGTPEMDKLTLVKPLATKSFNGHNYFKTKLGVFSCSTGRKIVQSDIVNLFAN